jgi:tRNA-modifying protein YgfZ
MSIETQLAAVEGGVGALDQPAGDVLRLAGGDALLALDRVVSQEVRSLRDGEGRLALLLAPKGQFRALLAVFRAAGEAFLLAPPGRGAEVAASLAGYLRLSRVVVEPVDWSGGATLLLGPDRERVAQASGAGTAAIRGGGAAISGAAGERTLWLGRCFAGAAGAVAVCESDAARPHLAEALAAAGAVPLVAEVVELERIRRGFPAWGAELTETVLPPEVGIDELAVSYSKGCYVGQETIARMRTYGHPNRALVAVRQTGGAAESPPSLPLPLAAAGEDKTRGALTSFARHPRHGGVGLALVRREVAAEGTALTGGGLSFAVSALPLW